LEGFILTTKIVFYLGGNQKLPALNLSHPIFDGYLTLIVAITHRFAAVPPSINLKNSGYAKDRMV